MKKLIVLASLLLTCNLFGAAPPLSNSTLNITFGWNAVAGASGYKLYWRAPNSTNWFTTNFPNAIQASMVVQGTPWIFALTATNNVGMESPPSAEVNFVPLSAPTLTLKAITLNFIAAP